jgi:hypothetical protein
VAIVPGVLKRGMWQFSNAEVGPVTLDNGVTMDIAAQQKLIDAKNELMKGRAKAMEHREEKKKAAPVAP